MNLIGSTGLNPYKEVGDDIECLIRLDKAASYVSDKDLAEAIKLYVNTVSKGYLVVFAQPEIK